MKSEVYNQSKCIMSAVAYQYYVEEKSRTEISESLALSPSTISRLLKRAKEEKIIEFNITEPYLTCNRIENKLQKDFGLKSVLVVPVSEEEIPEHAENIKKQVALEGARYVQRIIKNGDVLGLGWGGTMYHLIQYLNPCRKVNASIVTLHGSIANADPKLEVKTLVRRAAMAFGGQNVSLMAPGLYDSSEGLQRIKECNGIKNIFNLLEKIDIAVSGVGSLYPDMDSLLVTADYLNKKEMIALREKNAYSDILLRFLDKEGKECDTSLKDRTLSISLESYKKIPCKIIVASGSKKGLSVLALLKGGLVDVLIIDLHLAKALLSLDTY